MESQPQPQAQASVQPQPPSAAEDETIKKNTDCVYFLASPLTCKKGSECEYRHSDIARLNPKDCWFWLHSNCLNPKCAFRHPPLDGLVGTEMPKPTGPSPPLFQNVATALTHVVPTGPRPCIFFKKGYCLKGDWCPFLHGPNPMSNKTMLIPEAAHVGEPATSKKPFGGVDNSTQEKKVSLTVVAKPVKVTPQPKPSMHVEHAIPKAEFTVNKRAPYTSVDFPNYRNVTSDVNGNPSVQRLPLLDEPGSINKKDEEVSREPSPGFDVLVDDERRDDGYYPGENQYGMSREHESHSEYDIGRSSDYSSIADISNERYQDPLAYNSHERFKDHRASSERVSGGRPYARTDSCGQVDELDLRHRLTKHKKLNGLRSVITLEHGRDRHVEDRSYGSCRDEQNFSRHENSLSSLLRGRISLPERSSSSIDRDMVRRSDRGTRLSPARQNLSSHKGRIGDRIKGRVEEEAFSNGMRNNRGLYSRRDVISGDSADFAAPKRLSELKNKKNGGEHVNDQQTLGKRKHFMSEDSKRKHFMSEDVKRSGDDVNFEGPMPLKEILKRKKGENVGDGNSSNNEGIFGDNNQNGGEDAVNESDKFTSVEKTDEEESKVVQSEDNEYEANEERERESDYEQVGGEEFELYDGEEEYHGEEEDDDDFAKKMDIL